MAICVFFQGCFLFGKLIRTIFGSGEASVQFGAESPIVAEMGMSILEIAQKNGVELEHFCGGVCSCSTCRVEVLSGGENLSAIQQNEAHLLGEKRVAQGDRLSCQAKVKGAVHVRVPDLF